MDTACLPQEMLCTVLMGSCLSHLPVSGLRITNSPCTSCPAVAEGQDSLWMCASGKASVKAVDSYTKIAKKGQCALSTDRTRAAPKSVTDGYLILNWEDDAVQYLQLVKILQSERLEGDGKHISLWDAVPVTST